MSRLWILPVLAFIAAIGIACSDEGEVLPTASTTPATISVTASSSAPTNSVEPSHSQTLSPTPSKLAEYTDRDGFVIKAPATAEVEEATVGLAKKGDVPGSQARSLVFRMPDGTVALGMLIAPNPGNLALEDWISTYPGWPRDPQEVSIGGERGLLFSVDQMGEHFPQAYFAHLKTVYTLQLNVFGQGGQPAGLTQRDFDSILEEFKFTR